MRAASGLIAGCLLLAPTLADGQPWRYVKKGAVYYTSNVNELPPEMKARILAAKAAQAEAEAARVEAAAAEAGDTATGTAPAEALPSPPASVSGRIKGQPARPAGSPMPASVGERPPAPPAPTPVEAPTDDPAAVRARLTQALTEARAGWVRARRQALLMPDGRTYAARTEAERRVAELEAALDALPR